MNTNLADPSALNTEAIRQFRRFPVGLVGFVGVLAVGATFWLLNRLALPLVAMCDGSPMAAGDTCTFGSRRGGDYELTYEEVLHRLEVTTLAQQLGAAVLLAALVATALIAVICWRRDVGASAQLGTPTGLLAADWDTSGTAAGAVAVPMAGLALFGLPMIAQLSRNGTVLVYVAAGVLAIVFAVAVWRFRTRGAALLQLLDGGVVAVADGRRQEVPWSQISVDEGSSSPRLRWSGLSHPIAVDNQQAQQIVRDRTGQGR